MKQDGEGFRFGNAYVALLAATNSLVIQEVPNLQGFLCITALAMRFNVYGFRVFDQNHCPLCALWMRWQYSHWWHLRCDAWQIISFRIPVSDLFGCVVHYLKVSVHSWCSQVLSVSQCIDYVLWIVTGSSAAWNILIHTMMYACSTIPNWTNSSTTCKVACNGRLF